MKKRLLFCLLGIPLLSFPSYGQYEKGTTYVGTTLRFGGTNTKFDVANIQKSNQTSLAPSLLLGKFYGDNALFGVAVGSDLSFYRWKASDMDYDFRSTQNQYTISPFVRHYKPIGSRFALFLQSAFRASLLHNTVKGNGEKDVKTGLLLGLGVTPGVSWRVSKRFALEADLNILSLDVSYKAVNKEKIFNFSSVATSSLNSTFALRASWYLQK